MIRGSRLGDHVICIWTFRNDFKMATAVNGDKKIEYGKVVISLENCLLPREKIDQTPSMKDGLERDVEIDLRIVACEFIQAAGILLKLPQVLKYN